MIEVDGAYLGDSGRCLRRDRSIFEASFKY